MNIDTRKALELAREALQRGDTYDREHAIAAIDAALSAHETPVANAGWMKSGALLYRLTDDRKPVNRDEIRVTMADGSRTDEACSRRAGELFDMLAAATAVPVAQGEREALRDAQREAVTPLIGPLLDAWEGSRQQCREDLPELDKWLRRLNRAMEDAPAPAAPVARPSAADIDAAIYAQCPDFDDWHEGPSIDDVRSIVCSVLALRPAPAAPVAPAPTGIGQGGA